MFSKVTDSAATERRPIPDLCIQVPSRGCGTLPVGVRVWTLEKGVSRGSLIISLLANFKWLFHVCVYAVFLHFVCTSQVGMVFQCTTWGLVQKVRVTLRGGGDQEELALAG